MTEKTSVVVVDEHPVFRKGLRMLLGVWEFGSYGDSILILQPSF